MLMLIFWFIVVTVSAWVGMFTIDRFLPGLPIVNAIFGGFIIAAYIIIAVCTLHSIYMMMMGGE